MNAVILRVSPARFETLVAAAGNVVKYTSDEDWRRFGEGADLFVTPELALRWDKSLRDDIAELVAGDGSATRFPAPLLDSVALLRGAFGEKRPTV